MTDRLMRIAVHPSVIFGLVAVKEPVTYWTTGVPDDATLVRWYYDYPSEQICLVLHSPSFEEVPQGKPIPVLEVTFHREW